MHRLVSLATRNWMKVNAELHHWTVSGLRLLADEFSFIAVQDSGKQQSYLSHALVIWWHGRESSTQDPAACRLAHKLYWFCRSAFELEYAGKLLSVSVPCFAQNYGSLNMRTVNAKYCLAEVYSVLGYDERAQTLLEAMPSLTELALPEESGITQSLSCFLTAFEAHGMTTFKSFGYYSKALDLAKETSTKWLMFSMMDSLASAELHLGHHNHAYEILRDVLGVLQLTAGCELSEGLQTYLLDARSMRRKKSPVETMRHLKVVSGVINHLTGADVDEYKRLIGTITVLVEVEKYEEALKLYQVFIKTQSQPTLYVTVFQDLSRTMAMVEQEFLKSQKPRRSQKLLKLAIFAQGVLDIEGISVDELLAQVRKQEQASNHACEETALDDDEETEQDEQQEQASNWTYNSRDSNNDDKIEQRMQQAQAPKQSDEEADPKDDVVNDSSLVIQDLTERMSTMLPNYLSLNDRLAP